MAAVKKILVVVPFYFFTVTYYLFLHITGNNQQWSFFFKNCFFSAGLMFGKRVNPQVNDLCFISHIRHNYCTTFEMRKI